MAGDEAREVDGSEIMKGLCAHLRNVFLKAVGSGSHMIVALAESMELIESSML